MVSESTSDPTLQMKMTSNKKRVHTSGPFDRATSVFSLLLVVGRHHSLDYSVGPVLINFSFFRNVAIGIIWLLKNEGLRVLGVSLCKVKQRPIYECSSTQYYSCHAMCADTGQCSHLK